MASTQCPIQRCHYIKWIFKNMWNNLRTQVLQVFHDSKKLQKSHGLVVGVGEACIVCHCWSPPLHGNMDTTIKKRLQLTQPPQFFPFNTSLEVCQTRESWCMNQSTTFKSNFQSWKFCAKRFEHTSAIIFKKWAGLTRKCVVNKLSDIDCVINIF